MSPFMSQLSLVHAKNRSFFNNTNKNSMNGIRSVLSIQTPSFSSFSMQRLISENFFRGSGQKHSHTLNTSFKGSERIQNSGARISTAHFAGDKHFSSKEMPRENFSKVCFPRHSEPAVAGVQGNPATVWAGRRHGGGFVGTDNTNVLESWAHPLRFMEYLQIQAVFSLKSYRPMPSSRYLDRRQWGSIDNSPHQNVQLFQVEVNLLHCHSPFVPNSSDPQINTLSFFL